MAVRRVLLTLSVTHLPTNGVVGVDASGFDRGHASKTTRIGQTVDSAVESHISPRYERECYPRSPRDDDEKHDSQIVPLLITRNTDEVMTLLGDKRYDEKIRALAREEDVRPLVKHREFSSLHNAWNARLDADLTVSAVRTGR
jgi:hypothetical protein